MTPQPRLRRRKNIVNLSEAQLGALRAGVAALMGLSDNRGYGYLAGIHGLPLQFCQHSHLPHQFTLFLPWHRAYLYVFERTMRDQVPDSVVAWWDWSSPASHGAGIPAAFADEQLDGQRNPLFSAEVSEAARIDGEPTQTFRDTSGPGQLPSEADVAALLELIDFRDFSSALQDIHDGIHGWVGGTMASVAWAAFDPIFWAHHTMVDRLWSLWQLRHPQNAYPPEFLSQALPPFPLSVGQVLNVHALGYDYASATSHALVA